jgi:transposase
LFLIERQGLSQGRAARLVGAHRQTVNTWVKRHREQGGDGLLDGRRASSRRGKGLLSANEAGQIRAWIVGQTPGQLELPFALWTASATTASTRAGSRASPNRAEPRRVIDA